MNKKFNFISNFKVKEAQEEDKLIIEGYANTTAKDRAGDVIVKEAWLGKGLDNFLKNPIILAYHDYTKPVGELINYEVTDKGLFIVAEISKAAQEVYGLVKDGVLKAFSVGFRVKDAEYDKSEDTFMIKDVELYEISVVSVPANADSIFSVAKQFEDQEEYSEFKKSFIKSEPEEKETTVKADSADTSEQKKEDQTSLEDVKSIIVDSLNEIKTELFSSKEQDSSDKLEKEETMSVEVKDTGAEQLIKDLEARLEQKEKSFEEALNGLRADIKEKVAEKDSEIAAILKSKMQFQEKGSVEQVSDSEKEQAVLLSKMLGKPISQTKMGSGLIQKVGEHIDVAGVEWENTLSTNIYNEMTDNLVVEPIFSQINMNTPTLQIPINPDPGASATWVDGVYYTGDPATGIDPLSTGAQVVHKPTDTTLTAYKLATKDTLGDEEEEDSILPLMPLLRSALVRRMAAKADESILRSTGTDGGVTIFKGLTQLAADAGATDNSLAGVSGDVAVTLDDMHVLRKGLGTYGVNPSEVVYIISVDAYYDLMNTTGAGTTNNPGASLVTVDKYGPGATILTGEVGKVWGSTVLVSNNFAAKATGAAWGVAVNASNFIKGSLRGLKVESERTVATQNRLIVATRRMGFIPLIGSVGASSGVYGTLT